MRIETEYRAKTITLANVLKVSISTNCPCGGDAGHGGKTVFELNDLGGSSGIYTQLDSGATELVSNVRITMKGDSECHSIIEALEFAAKSLSEIVKNNYSQINEQTTES